MSYIITKKGLVRVLEDISWRLLAFVISVVSFWFAAIMWNADRGYPYLLQETAWWIKNYPFDAWIPFRLFLVISSTIIMTILVVIGIHFALCIIFPGKFPSEKGVIGRDGFNNTNQVTTEGRK